MSQPADLPFDPPIDWDPDEDASRRGDLDDSELEDWWDDDSQIESDPFD